MSQVFVKALMNQCAEARREVAALKAQRDELLAGLERAATDLELAISAIQGLKVEAETAGAGGDEQMLQDACEAISNEGLAHQTKLYAAVKKARAIAAKHKEASHG